MELGEIGDRLARLEEQDSACQRHVVASIREVALEVTEVRKSLTDADGMITRVAKLEVITERLEQVQEQQVKDRRQIRGAVISAVLSLLIALATAIAGVVQ